MLAPAFLFSLLGWALPPSQPVAAAGVPRLDHVAIIMMENKAGSQIMGSAAAPYINQLAQRYASDSSYFAIAHPSLPNYLALVSGSTQGITADCTTCFVNAPSVGDRLPNGAWRAYMEDMPQPCFVGDAGLYAQRHDPFIYFDSIRANPQRCASIVPFTQLAQDLGSGQLPAFSFITPNLCHDMHDCPIAQGDQWLSQQVPAILGSPAFARNSALFIVWDEDDGSSVNQVPLIVAGSAVEHGLVSGVRTNHYGLLHTIEMALGIAPVGALDGSAAPLTDVFGAPAPGPQVASGPGAGKAPAGPANPPPPGPLCPTLGPVLWGMYQTGYPSDLSRIEALESQLGHPADVIEWFAQWADGSGGALASWQGNVPAIGQVAARGGIPMITWEPWGGGGSFAATDIAAGRYDAYIDSWARGAAAIKPQAIWIRPFEEFNTGGYPWAVGRTGPAALVAAWRHLHDRFMAAGATNVAWIWSPAGSSLDPAQLRASYPGDQYVTYTGWDDFGDDSQSAYRTVAAVSGKPMVLGEVGSTDPGWLGRLSSALDGGAMPLVRAVVWFDEDDSQVSTALESQPTTLGVVAGILTGRAFHGPPPARGGGPPPAGCPQPGRPASPTLPLAALDLPGGFGMDLNQQPDSSLGAVLAPLVTGAGSRGGTAVA